jgi:hypothetical protein
LQAAAAARVAGKDGIIEAAKGGAIAIVRDYLLADASSVNTRDHKCGKTASTPIFEHLIPRSISLRSALHWSAYRSHTEVSELLLSANADVNARCQGYHPYLCPCFTIDLLIPFPISDFTPLHRSALNEHVDVCKLLLSANADVNARTHM